MSLVENISGFTAWATVELDLATLHLWGHMTLSHCIPSKCVDESTEVYARVFAMSCLPSICGAVSVLEFPPPPQRKLTSDVVELNPDSGKRCPHRVAAALPTRISIGMHHEDGKDNKPRVCLLGTQLNRTHRNRRTTFVDG